MAFSDGKSAFLHVFAKMRNAQNGENEQNNGELISEMPQKEIVKSSRIFKVDRRKFRMLILNVDSLRKKCFHRIWTWGVRRAQRGLRFYTNSAALLTIWN